MLHLLILRSTVSVFRRVTIDIIFIFKYATLTKYIIAKAFRSAREIFPVKKEHSPVEAIQTAYRGMLKSGKQKTV